MSYNVSNSIFKDHEKDEYAPKRLSREQDQVRACQHASAEWTLELQGERTAWFQ
jgi:hypothetical protein